MNDLERLRHSVLGKRDSLSADEIRTRSRIVLGKFEAIDAIGKASLIGCYMPRGSEIDTAEIVESWLGRGKQVAVTVRDQGGLALAPIRDPESLVRSPEGRLEPAPDARQRLDPGDLDVLIVPGIAYSRSRRRVGYGDGLFTTLLEQVGCIRIAPVYDLQLVSDDELGGTPAGSVDLVVGETIIYET